MHHTEDAEVSVVRSRIDGSKMCTLKLCTNNEMRRHEFDMYKKLENSQFVGSVLSSGSSSSEVFFGVGELVTGALGHRIIPEQGIADEDEFWRLASQLVSGIADIHSAGVIHLAVEVRDVRFCSFDLTHKS